MNTRLMHRLRRHKIAQVRKHWYDPPGETPRGPYDVYVCNCGQEWVICRPDRLGPLVV